MSIFIQKYSAWVMLGLAVLMWIGVGFFARVVSSEEVARAERLAHTEEALVQQSSELRLRALARETSGTREKLEEIARKDVVEILKSMEKVGKDVGIPLEVGGALSTPVSNTGAPTSMLRFTVSLEGSFTKVIQAIAMLESLPTPSSTGSLRVEQLPTETSAGKSGKSIWRGVIEMRFLTTFPLSS